MDLQFWVYVACFALVELVMWRVYSRSTVRRLRVALLSKQAEQRDERIDYGLLLDERDALLERLELTANDLRKAGTDLQRCERKLHRARTSRARWQAQAANWQRMYRGEFQRAHQAETRLMRAEYRARYPEREAGANGSNGRDCSVYMSGYGAGNDGGPPAAGAKDTMVCGRLLIDGQTTCGRCTLPAHEDGTCQIQAAPTPAHVGVDGTRVRLNP